MKSILANWNSLRNRAVGRLRDSYVWQKGVVSLARARGRLASRNFILLGAARSGSTLLVNYLNCHPAVRCHGEILNSESGTYAPVGGKTKERLLLHVQSFYVKRPGQHVGAKFLIRTFERLADLGEILRLLNRPRVIIIYRENQLESYVSLEIARQNNIWYSTSVVNHDAIEVDWQKFTNYVEEEQAAWKAATDAVVANECDACTVTFDELCDAPQESLARVFSFLGVPPTLVWTKSVRQNPRPLYEKILNFHDLHLDHPERARFLHLSCPWGNTNRASSNVGAQPCLAGSS